MNKKLIIPFALAPLAAPALQAQSQQSDGRMDTRPTSSFSWWMTWGGRIPRYLSGHKKRTIMKCTKPLTWNVLPNKA